MDSHGEDFRVEIQGREGADALLAALKNDYREAKLNSTDMAILDYAVKLTRSPQAMTEEDLAPLRAQALGDEAILEVVQVTALFNYYNRLADGLGIAPEPSA